MSNTLSQTGKSFEKKSVLEESHVNVVKNFYDFVETVTALITVNWSVQRSSNN